MQLVFQPHSPNPCMPLFLCRSLAQGKEQGRGKAQQQVAQPRRRSAVVSSDNMESDEDMSSGDSDTAEACGEVQCILQHNTNQDTFLVKIKGKLNGQWKPRVSCLVAKLQMLRAGQA